MKTAIAALAAAASLSCPLVASATIFKVSFTASEFNAIDGSTPLQDPVAGSITFTTPNSDYGIPSVRAVDLTIGSHTYTVGEIAGGTRGGGYGFGGKMTGLDDLTPGSDDFYLYFGGRGEGFGYSVAGLDGAWRTRVIRVSREEVASVPEPGSLALLLTGACAAGALRRRRRM